AAGLAQDAIGLQQFEQSLAGLMAADEQEVGMTVLPACQRDSALIAQDVHTVRDDLVVAWEVAIDEMSSRRAHRDSAVETSRVAAQETAAELVGRREPTVGVERGDVHAGRQPEQDR